MPPNVAVLQVVFFFLQQKSYGKKGLLFGSAQYALSQHGQKMREALMSDIRNIHGRATGVANASNLSVFNSSSHA